MWITCCAERQLRTSFEMISFRRNYSAYLLPPAPALLRFLAGSRAQARSPDCGEH
ncbi:hypothetical protein UM26_004535 [Salmonella enterica subsp. enterica]|nr:hypothetical protein [Salmonella enterica subsp. enterica]